MLEAERIDPLDHMGLVNLLAAKFVGRGLDFEDLAQEGFLGLMIARDKYQPGGPAKFCTYAGWWVCQNMRQAIADHSSTVKVPIHARTQLARIASDRMRIEDVGPSAQENIRDAIAAITCSVGGRPVSLAAAKVPGLPPDHLPREVVDALGRLREQEQHVLRMRFGLDGHPPMTHVEIGRRLGCCKQNVDKVRRRALRKLRERLGVAS